MSGEPLFRLTLTQALATLDPDAAAESSEPRDAIEEMLLPRAERTFAQLADVGLVVADGPGQFRVPEMLRGPFARAVVLAMTFAAEILGAADTTIDLDDPDAPSPFDDPEMEAEMARLGIVHTPGMAAEMLREIAPLLAEDGIDLDDLDIDNLDSLNAALARAIDRKNLELFTPIGEPRAMALTVHRLAAEALAEGSEDLARAVIDSIQPDPVGNLPSVAQVIGVGLGVLDEWHWDPASTNAVAQAHVPTWDPATMRAARDILRAARRGQAFDQLNALHLRHGGKRVLAGTVLAVAGTVIARATTEHTNVRELVGRILIAN